jgi:hypothetical protein
MLQAPIDGHFGQYTSSCNRLVAAYIRAVKITNVSPDQIRLLHALRESGRALRAFDEVERLCSLRQQKENGVEVREWISIFDAIRMALHFSANLSKMFWPSRDCAKERCVRLRGLIDLVEEHPLKSRNLRDDFDHLDERLDKWVGESPRAFMAIEMILSLDYPEATRQAVLQSTPVVYDEASKIVRVLDKEYDLLELRNAVTDVQQLISKAFEELLSAA